MWKIMISNIPPNWAEALTAVLSLATLFAVALAAVQIRHVNRQMHRELEMQYLLRFWVLMDRRSDKFMLKGIPTRADKILFQEYLGLCEDQIALRSLGRVTDHTWSYWSRDIRAMSSTEHVSQQLALSDREQYVHLRRLLIDEGYDPLRRRKLWRLSHGL